MSKSFKVVFLGDCGVGKSSLLTRYVINKFLEFNEPTIGASYINSTISIDNRKINLDIWDTAGQERFKGLVPLYYKNADCIILVYDITFKRSFENASQRITDLKSICPHSLIFLVGNKSDLHEQRVVERDLVDEYSKKNNIYFFETSAKNSVNVESLFKTIAKELSEIIVLEENTDTVININEENKLIKKRCC